MELAHSPETATQLGVSAEVAGYSYFSDLDDRSQAGVARLALKRIETLSALDQIETDGLPSDLATNFITVRTAYETAVNMRAFGHGQVALGFVRPYAVDQLSGGYIDVPDLLLNRQPVRALEEARFYLARLGALAGTIDDERRRLEADQRRGITPPAFILKRMQLLATDLASTDAQTHPLVNSLENQLIGLRDIPPGLREQILSEAERLVSKDIMPAYQRFINTLKTMEVSASDAPGIWQLSDGEAYYAAALEYYSGRKISPQDIHNEGLALVKDLTEELDLAFELRGFADGSVGERLAELGRQPDQVFANDEAGRLALIETVRARISAMEERFMELVDLAPSTTVSVAPVPEFLTQTAPGGYYIAAPADGTAPGLFFINLRDTKEWPAFTLPTLLFHETLPGHHLESSVVSEQVSLPLIRQMIWNPTFGEGWAVYAEDLAYEVGAYDDDPMGELGYLQSLLFRATRLVVDTGLHHERWSRQRAIDYLVTTTGQSVTAMETEVDRYTVWPGQATSYMSGRQTLRSLREQAEIILGNAFSLKKFHAVILNNGPRPMRLVERDVEAWIVATLN